MGIDGETVGFALLVVGALVALATVAALIFVPAATFTTLDAEMGAIVGVILVGIGVGARAAN